MPSPALHLTPEKLTDYFLTSTRFSQPHFAQLIDQADQALPSIHLIGHLNPIHPQLIHILGRYEIDFINASSHTELSILIENIINKGARYLIFQNIKNIPPIFFKQSRLHIIQTHSKDENLAYTITHEVNQLYAERISQHGSFVIIHGQGLLITGDSGTGKSSLLLALVEQNHLWVADDITLFYPNTKKQIIGHSCNKLKEFIHIKGLGPINMDLSAGKAARVESHPLDGIIHLSNDILKDTQKISAYTQYDTLNLLGIDFPRWYFSSTQTNLRLLAEFCAKNISLSKWGNNASDELEHALTNALQT